MLSPDYKQLFNSIIDNNVTQLHNLATIEGAAAGRLTNEAQEKMLKIYVTLRKKLNEDVQLNAAEIGLLNISASIALISIKAKLRSVEQVLKQYNEAIMPAFQSLMELPQENMVTKFYEVFSGPIISPEIQNGHEKDNIVPFPSTT